LKDQSRTNKMAELKKESPNVKIAIVRIRGGIALAPGITRTLELLQLYRQNFCVVVDGTPQMRGMINKVKDYVTWGEITDDTLKKLIEKRSESYQDHEGKKQVKKFFRLHPPVKGFERKGIKQPFNKGGALGYRKEKINQLIMRML
jgi:large subunit ribosomal protein L30